MGSPQTQESTLNTYFVPEAAFIHPFCRVPSFPKGTIPLASNIDSRWLILCIYRWYRTLSPKIDLTVDSAVFDQRTGVLYVNIHQVFRAWFVPFYKAPVRLVTVLQLTQRTSWDSSETVATNGVTEGREPALAGPGQERAKYYISSQEDLYQLNDALKFVTPGVGHIVWGMWQLFVTLLCTVLSVVFLPLYLLLNRDSGKKTR